MGTVPLSSFLHAGMTCRDLFPLFRRQECHGASDSSLSMPVVRSTRALATVRFNLAVASCSLATARALSVCTRARMSLHVAVIPIVLSSAVPSDPPAPGLRSTLLYDALAVTTGKKALFSTDLVLSVIQIECSPCLISGFSRADSTSLLNPTILSSVPRDNTRE